MKASFKKSPTGMPYIDIAPPGNWHTFPEFAEKLLHLLGAIEIHNISRLEAADSHWYEFVWEGDKCRLIYEDWPHQISVESTANEKRFCELLEKIAVVLRQC